MKGDFTLKELSELAQIEKDLHNKLCNNPSVVKPSKNVIDNILAYSKVLSVRKSEKIDTIELVLN